MNKWCLRLSFYAIIACFFTVLGSWLVELFGGNVHSLISEAGIIWLLQYWRDMANGDSLLNLIMYTQAYGIMAASGLNEALYTLAHPQRTIAYAQRITLLFVGVIFVAFVAFVCYYTFYEDAPLRSTDGTWATSPLVVGRSLVVSFVCNLLAALYGLMSERFTTFENYISALTHGVSAYAAIPLLYITGSTLYHLLGYVVGGL